MKKIIRLFAISLMMSIFCGHISAQKTDRQRISREELAEKQARHIANSLVLEDATAEKFVTTFCAYQREIWALKSTNSKRKNREQYTASEEETAQELKEQFMHSQKLLDIRQKYYTIYSGFLTQKQIKRVYEQERSMMERLAKKKPASRTAPMRRK